MSIEKAERSKIIIDIDSLFDVRQSKLGVLGDKERVTEYLLGDQYNFREMDDFSSYVDMNKYKELTDIKKLLMYSSVTYIIGVVYNKINKLETTNAIKDQKTLPEVVINTYPYDIEPRLMEIIQNAVFFKLKKSCFVTMARIEPSELTPYYINNANVSFLFIYDYSEWLTKQSTTMSELKIESAIVYFPSLYKQMPTKQETDELSKLGFKEFFSYMEYMYSPYAMIRFLPVVMYSNELVAAAMMDRMDKIIIKKAMQEQDKVSPNVKINI